MYSHYSHTLDATHLDLAKAIIAKDYPEYIPFLNQVYTRTWGYMFNMAIMPKKYLDKYCAWIFDILEKLEEQIDVSQLDAFSGQP